MKANVLMGAIRCTHTRGNGSSFKLFWKERPARAMRYLLPSRLGALSLGPPSWQRSRMDRFLRQGGPWAVSKVEPACAWYRERLRDLSLTASQLYLEPDQPVIMMSGYSLEQTEAQMNADQIAGFLHKPFTAQSLRKVLEEILPAPCWPKA